MAFTVPNRPDGVAQDQAEPDKGDFQTLGYQKSGVLTGGATTRTATNTVTVEALTGYLNGEYFSIGESDLPSFTAPPSGNAKFVLILVQKSGSTFNVYGEQGTAANKGQSATNAMFPNDVDYSAKMLIAAVYYASGDTDISASSIVDKRVFVLPQANPQGVTSTPGDGVGALGEIRVDTSQSLANGQSNVWIKTATAGTGRWTNLGKYALNTDGSDGDAASITIGTVTTGAAGSQASVSNRGTSTAAILDFTIPGGTSGGGSVGPAGTITIGSVSTGAAGSSAAVFNSGSSTAAILNFTIPRGADGSGASYNNWKLTADNSTYSVTTGQTINLIGGSGVTLSHSGNGTVTINANTAGAPSGYNWSLYTSGNPSPAAQVAAYEHVSFHGAGGITVRNTDRTVTIDGSNISPSAYSFKTTAGGLNPQQTITNGGVVSYIGGTDMSVTQSGSTFTFNYVGTTSAEYVSTTKTTPQTLLSPLYTEDIWPTTSATYVLGSPWLRYVAGYFSGDVYAGAFIAPSDRSLKQSFGASPGLGFINALGPLSFEFKDAPGETRWGLVAQDVEAVCDNLGIPAVVAHDQPETGNKHLNYMEFTAPIIKAIQELSARVEALENG